MKYFFKAFNFVVLIEKPKKRSQLITLRLNRLLFDHLHNTMRLPIEFGRNVVHTRIEFVNGNLARITDLLFGIISPKLYEFTGISIIVGSRLVSLYS